MGQLLARVELWKNGSELESVGKKSDEPPDRYHDKEPYDAVNHEHPPLFAVAGVLGGHDISHYSVNEDEESQGEEKRNDGIAYHAD